MHLVRFKLFGDGLLNDGGLAIVRGDVREATAFWQEEFDRRAAATKVPRPILMIRSTEPITDAEVERRRAAGETIHQFAESPTPTTPTENLR